VVLAPLAGDQGRERGGGPRVEDVVVADEATGLPPLLFGVAGWNIGARVDREVFETRPEGVRVVGLAVVVEAVPQWDGHAEEPLSADQPVTRETLRPVAIPHLHVVGHPLEPLSQLEHLLSELGIAAAVADVPLAAGDDLEWTVTLLVVLDGVRYRPGLAVEVARLGQQLDHPSPGLVDVLARQLGVCGLALPGRDPGGCLLLEPAVP